MNSREEFDAALCGIGLNNASHQLLEKVLILMVGKRRNLNRIHVVEN